jgi:hypothetical protein
MYGGEGTTPRLPLAYLLGEGTLASILWWQPSFLFRCPHTRRQPHWWRLALLRPFAGGVDPPYIACSLLLFRGLSM